MNINRTIYAFIVVVSIVLAYLWFSDYLPLKVSEAMATRYLLNQENGNKYELIGSDYSSAHDCYFVYFINEETSEQRNIGIYYRFLPINIFFDSAYPG